jgi:hypothetical protein
MAGGTALLLFVRFAYSGISGQRQFRSWTEIGLYYLLPAAVALFFAASLRLAPIRKLRLLTSVVAIVLSAYLLELFLTVSGSGQITAFSALDYQTRLRPEMVRLSGARNKQQYAADLAKRFGAPIDIRTAGEVIGDRQKAGVETIPIVTATNHLLVYHPDGSITSAISIDGLEVVPLATVSNRETLLCNESGQWVDYRSDSRGFNNPEAAWTAPVRIAALGDSFTQGYCVRSGSSFVDLIRQYDGATLNLGVAGDGPLLMLATLKEYVSPLEPRIVLWFYFEGNDLVDLQVERKMALMRNYLRDDFRQPALARQADVDRAIMAEVPAISAKARKDIETRAWNTFVYGSIAFLKLSALRDRLAPLDESNPQLKAAAADFETANMAVFDDILRQAKARVQSWHGELYFVYLPEWARYTKYSSWGKDKRDAVLRVVSGLGIPIIDIDPAFRASGDPLSLFPFRSSGHYNEAGHKLVADTVIRALSPGRRTALSPASAPSRRRSGQPPSNSTVTW